jgi:hypothetical protein
MAQDGYWWTAALKAEMNLHKFLQYVCGQKVLIKLKEFPGILFKERMSEYGLDIVLQSSVVLKLRDLLEQLSWQLGKDAPHHSR